MDRNNSPLECVAFMLIRNNEVLVEKRSLSKHVVPGATAIPGGHLEVGEDPETALLRELDEEISVIPINYYFVCTLLHRAEEFRKLHYFAVKEWQGEIQSHEAQSLLWLPLDDLDQLTLPVDLLAIREYIRLYRA